MPAQFAALARWPDGSIKWLLVDFVADCPANSSATYRLADSGARPAKMPSPAVEDSEDAVRTETDVMRCVMDRKQFNMFRSVHLDHDRNGIFSESERITAPAQVDSVRLVDSLGHEISSMWGTVRSFNVYARKPEPQHPNPRQSMGSGAPRKPLL